MRALLLLSQFRQYTNSLPCFFAKHNNDPYGALLVYPREGYSLLVAYDGEYWQIWNNGYDCCLSSELADVLRKL